MKRMIMSESMAAYAIVVMLVLFALLTSCAPKPINMSRGYKNPTEYHRTPAKGGGTWVNVK